MNEANKKSLLEELDSISEVFNQAMKEIEIEQENYWKSLSPEQQLMAFCAISRRIYKGEIEDGGTYRYVLYDVFGWGPEAYAPAQMARYLEIHNSIYPHDHDQKLLDRFCKSKNIEITEQEIFEFLHGKLTLD